MKVNMSIVIPCYNEEKNIYRVYYNIKDNIPGLVGGYEIIFVNDGSTDGSKEKIEKLKQLDSYVRHINFKKNQGYGFAVREGFRVARYAYVLYIDGDGQYDFSDAERVLKIMLSDNLDMVAPYRQRREDRFYRRGISWLGNFFCRTIFGINYKDINCGFKLLRKECIDKMGLECNSGVLFSLWVYLKVKKLHLRLKQIPVRHLKRKEGSEKGISTKQYLLAINDFYNSLKQ